MKTSNSLYCYEEHKDRIKPYIEAHDCLSVVALPHMGKNRILKSIAEELGKTINFIMFNEINDFIKQPSSSEILVIQGISLMDTLIEYQKFQKLERYRSLNSKGFSIVYCFTFDPRLSPSLSNLRTLTSNIITLSPNKDFFSFLIHQNEERYCIELDEMTKESLFELTNANPLLVKQAFLNIVSNQELTTNFDVISKNIISEFTKYEINIIKIALKKDGNERKFLNDIGHLINGQLIPKSISDEYISNLVSSKLKIKNEKIFLKGIDITSEFTNYEIVILHYLRKNSFISRSKISELIKGKSNSNDVSEASIDKVISRLRQKLQSYKINDFITTYKGRGYYVDYSYWL